METTSDLLFYVNGRRVVARSPDPDTTLLQYLRLSLGLTGTKLGCAVGGCGACTVMVSWFERRSGVVRHAAVNACLARLCSLHGRAVTTVEGVGSTRGRGRLHPVQGRIASSHGSQCGFCTPGMVMSMYALLRNGSREGKGGEHSRPTGEELEAALAGNLCRCTGYRPIVEAFRVFTREEKEKKKSQGGPSCYYDPLIETGMQMNVQPVSNGCYVQETEELMSNNAQSMSYCAVKVIQLPSRSDIERSEACPTNVRELLGDADTRTNHITSTSRNNLKNQSTSNADSKPEVNCNGMSPEINGCAMGENCCMKLKASNEIREEMEATRQTEIPYDVETQEAIFPSELQLEAERIDSDYLIFKSERTAWYRPTRLDEVLRLKDKYPNARLIAGNTDIGVEVKVQNKHYPVLIAVSHVKEFTVHGVASEGLEIGASVTLSDLQEILARVIDELPEEKTRFFVSIADMLKLVASKQIRNVASVGGHIAAASAVSDLNPLFQVTGCLANVMSATGGLRIVKIDQNFYTGRKSTTLSASEILVSVIIPFSVDSEHVFGFKQERKKSDDVASVTSAMKVKFHGYGNVVEHIALSFSGMAQTTIMAVNTARALEGQPWDDDICGTRLLMEELQLKPDAPGGKIAYRMSLVQGMFYKFYLSTRLMLERKHPHLYKTLTPQSYKSAVIKTHRPSSKGVQFYEQVDDQQLKVDTVGRPFPHLSSNLHATGEAVYTDDMTPFGNELHLVLVTSTKAHARIVSVDTKDALRMDGVVDFITSRDVPGSNAKGHKTNDEEIFRTKFVTCEGQAIGAILADTRANAVKSAKAVKVEYEELRAILNIEDAIQAKSFIADIPEMNISKGNIKEGMAASDHIIEGKFCIGGQNHFYMETQSCIAVPKCENDEMEIFSSTQSAMLIQAEVGKALNVDRNKIVVRVKRLGGGFGGKETNSCLVALPVSIAAYKHQKPVRCKLDRDEDMVIAGGRHPFMAEYKVGFTKEGKILALEARLYSNGGYSADVSRAVLEEALFHVDNSYFIPNVLVTGRVCKTNLATSTSFRGFGSPQAILMCENWITEVANELGVSPMVIRERNLYKEGDTTHYNNPISNLTLRRCWDEVIINSNYASRIAHVEKFNVENRWKKRGISVTPIKEGIGTGMCLDQAGALVNIYRDGSVLISHGGIEMGQGLHTKIVQIASRVLEIPTTAIVISESNSSIVPNASPTSASHSSDLNGQAVLNACQTLKERLEPYKRTQLSNKWEDWVTQAYTDMVSLSATGFHRTTGLNYDWNTNTGQRFIYYTMGAACSEVEIDCLTGEHVLLRTDIVMDVGKSLNPAIDVGQIEGGFIQGYGLFVLEQLKYTPEGLLRSKGPATYKVPSLSDIPIEFNVSILKGASNPKAVYSSKGIGEPPLNLAASVFFALRKAVEAARAEEGLGCRFSFHSPATAEAIRLAIVNELGHTSQV